MADSRALEKKQPSLSHLPAALEKTAKKNSILDRLPFDLRWHVISFLCGKRVETYKINHPLFRYQHMSFFFDLNVSYAIEATRNLLRRIKVDETIELIKQYPKILSIPVEVKDINNQRIKGTLLQVLASAGEFDPLGPVTMRKHGKPHGLVPLLSSLGIVDFKSQLKERFKEGHSEATRQRMLPVKNAIITFIDDVIRSPDIVDGVPFETLLTLPIVNKFIRAIKPNPDDVVILGLAWDMQIFIDFIDMFENKFRLLGGKWSCKSDFVDVVVWSALQARSPICAIEIFAKGLGDVGWNHQLPDRFDFSNVDFPDDVPEFLKGIGITHFFGLKGGEKYSNDGEQRKQGGGARIGTWRGGCTTAFVNIMSNQYFNRSALVFWGEKEEDESGLFQSACSIL